MDFALRLKRVYNGWQRVSRFRAFASLGVTALYYR